MLKIKINIPLQLYNHISYFIQIIIQGNKVFCYGTGFLLRLLYYIPFLPSPDAYFCNNSKSEASLLQSDKMYLHFVVDEF